ncbi:MAG TPA: helix-turn-helix domain-containing protein [Dehalococcoidia bacterium]|nr:helix-turn-helix domain-containing protein [Dehalococcoidia bacterium]
MTMGAMVDERYLTTAEIAAKLHVTEWTVRQWLNAGKLRGSRPGGRRAGWRVRESDFVRFLDRTANRPDGGEAAR